MSEQPQFPLFENLAEIEKRAAIEARAVAGALARRQRLESHRESRRICWPEWEGPEPGATGLAGWCELESDMVIDEATGNRVMNYCAPCRILELLPDGVTYRLEIDYGDDAPEHCRAENGTVLLATDLEIWAPVRALWAKRNADSVAEALAEGRACDCGSTAIEHVYGGGFECAPCREKRLAPEPPKPKTKTPRKPKT